MKERERERNRVLRERTSAEGVHCTGEKIAQKKKKKRKQARHTGGIKATAAIFTMGPLRVYIRHCSRALLPGKNYAPCLYSSLYTPLRLPPSPVCELGGKPKWLPLTLGYSASGSFVLRKTLFDFVKSSGSRIRLKFSEVALLGLLYSPK